MINKIVHIADIHFRNIQRHKEFRAICENFFDQMKREKPDRIVIAGDIVHSRNQISPELVNEVSWFLSGCSKLAEIVVVIPGNHDIVEQNKDRMDALTPIIEALGLDNIVYYTKTGVYVDQNVAWVVYSLFDANVTPAEANDPQYKDKVRIGLFHGTIIGATNNLGFTFDYGSDKDKFNCCNIALCGDIHKRQVLKTSTGVHVVYVGSFIQQEFGETVSQHGFNTVHLDNGQINYVFTDIENPIKYLNFKITDFSDIEEGAERLTNA